MKRPLPTGGIEKRRRWLRTVTILPVGAAAYPKGTGSTYRSCFAVCRRPRRPVTLFSPYILCNNPPADPIVQNAEIGPKNSCKNHKKSAKTPLTTRGFSIIIGKYARKRWCTPGSVYTAMNREIAPQGGNFRGVCPIIGRLRMFCSPA